MPQNVFTSQRVLSAHELTRMGDAIAGTWLMSSDAGGAVTPSANMTLAVAAITAGRVIVNGTRDSAGYAGGTVTVSTAHASLPRRDYVYFEPGVGCGVTAGTPAAKPALPTLTAGRIALAEVYVAANDTVIGSSEIIDRRTVGVDAALNAIAQNFVEASQYKGFFAMLAPAGITYSTGGTSTYSLGSFLPSAAGASSAVSGGTTNPGSLTFTTGAGSAAEQAYLIGPRVAVSGDFTLVFRGILPSASSQTLFVGLKTNPGATDENNLIAFRVSGTGNIVGVCDNAGTETQRDSGATGATECTLRIEIRSGGTIVRFYRNNVQIGADVTTNIPTGTLYTIIGTLNGTAADRPMYAYDIYGWREVG